MCGEKRYIQPVRTHMAAVKDKMNAHGPKEGI
jgi:hypothetical protein